MFATTLPLAASKTDWGEFLPEKLIPAIGDTFCHGVHYHAVRRPGGLIVGARCTPPAPVISSRTASCTRS